MDEYDIRQRYREIMFTGAQTQEKHVRYAAEELVKHFGGGFYFGADVDAKRERTVPWETNDGTVDVTILLPAGLHGYALQMVIEEQIRVALKP